jgi:hypothetical protein
MGDSADVPETAGPGLRVDGTGCLGMAGVVLCGTVFLAPLGIVLVLISLVMLIVGFVRDRARTRADGPCPRCEARLLWMAEGDRCRCHQCGTALRIVGRGYELAGST